MLHGASDRYWPVSQERKVPETPKLIGRLLTPWAITCRPTRIEVKRSKIKVTRLINSETELQTCQAVRACAIKCFGQPAKLGSLPLLYTAGSIPCRPHSAATQLFTDNYFETRQTRELDLCVCQVQFESQPTLSLSSSSSGHSLNTIYIIQKKTAYSVSKVIQATALKQQKLN